MKNKKSFLLGIFFMLFSSAVFAQIKGLTYQATILNSSKNIAGENPSNSFSNKTVCLKFSVLSLAKNILFQEIIITKTDDFGILNVVVGSGVPSNNYNFKNIDELESSNEGYFFRVDVCFSSDCIDFELLNEQPINRYSINTQSAGKPFFENAIKGVSESRTAGDSQILAIENGGTGSSTKIFVDLTTNQTIKGNKIFSDSTVFENGIKVQNITFGYGSGNLPTNTIIGRNAFNKNMSGEFNTALGLYALSENLSSYNTAVGHYSLITNTEGYGNTALGAQTLFNNKLGSRNLAIGLQALNKNTNGDNNTAIGGTNTMFSNLSGSFNTAIGGKSLYSNITGSNNVAVGLNSLYDNVSGNNNVSVGLNAGYKNKSNSNVFLGSNAGLNNIDGESNIFLGTNAGTNVTGSRNIIIGNIVSNINNNDKLNIGGVVNGDLVTGDVNILGNIEAKNLTGLNTGDQDVSNKEDIINKSTDGSFITNSDVKYPSEKATKTYVDNAISVQVPDASPSEKGKIQLAGDLTGTADLPVINIDAITTSKIKNANVTDEKIVSINASKIVGALAIENGGTGSSTKNFVDLISDQAILGGKTFNGNIIFGNDIKVRNIKIGHGSGNLPTNTIIGINAFSKNIYGEYNTALGLNALDENLSSFNTAIGHYTLLANTTGYANTAIGAQALFLNQTGNYNLGVGVEALARNTTGLNNSAVGGYDTMLNNTTGSNNTALGYASMYSNISGGENVALGINTLYENLLGNGNIAIGSAAGYKSSGDFNIFIGYATARNNTSGQSNIYIGSYSGNNSSGSKNIVIGENITNDNPTGDNQLNIGDILKGDLVTGDIKISGNITAKNLIGIDRSVYFDFDNTNQLSSSLSYETTTLQVTIEEGGDYIIDFSGSYENDAPGSKNSIAIFVDGELVQNSERSDTFINAGDVRSVSTKTYLTSLLLGQIIEIKYKVTSGTVILYSSTLIATKR